MTSPLAEPLPVTTNTIAVAAAGPPHNSGAGTPSAKVRWRLAGSGQDETQGWNDDSTADLDITNTAAGVKVTGTWDTSTATEDTSSGTPVEVPDSTPVLLDVQVCVAYTAGDQCTWAVGEHRVLRVAHAFGGNYPTVDVPGGQVAQWTGELSISSPDVTVPTPSGGGLSVSRVANTYDGPETVDAGGNSSDGVFGPGWRTSLDGPDGGASYLQVQDSTLLDGTLKLIDPAGDTPLIYAQPGSDGQARRRTTANLNVGLWEPVDEDTESAGLRLKVAGAGAAATITATDDVDTVTSYKTTSTDAPTSTRAGSFRVESVDQAGSEGATTFSYDSSGRITRMLAPAIGVTCPATGTLPAGCRAMAITYGTSTTATSSTPGDVSGQVKQISMIIGAGAGGSATQSTTPMSAYAYDTADRLTTVTDPRNNLAVKYAYDGTSDRIATLTPPGLKPITFEYSSGAQPQLARVKRERPASAGGGTATLATLVYDIPVAGAAATDLGLPSLSRDSVARWAQAAAPVAGFAVFGPDAPVSSREPEQITAAQWKRAALTYTDSKGRMVNTVGYGPEMWLYTATDYNDLGSPIRELDSSDIRAVLDLDTPVSSVGTFTSYNSARTALLPKLDPSTGQPVTSGEVEEVEVLAAGSLVTDVYGPGREVMKNDGTRVWARPHTKTVYDEAAPNNAVRPKTRHAYGLPTSERTDAVTAVGSAGQTVETYAVARTNYATAVEGQPNKGWELGLAGTVSTELSDDSGQPESDIKGQVRYNADGRVIVTSLPKSNGLDAGARLTDYYTAGGTGACGGKPAWAGLECRTRYAASPSSGPALPTTTATEFSELLAPTRITETAGPDGALLRTSTTTYRTDGAISSSHVVDTVAATEAVPAQTFSYDPDTGLPATARTGTGVSEQTIGQGYDAWGRVVTYTNDFNETTTTTYDTAGRVATIEDPTGTVTMAYNGADAEGRIESRSGLATEMEITNPGGSELRIKGAYDSSGALTRQDLPGGIIFRRAFDTAGRLTGVSYHGQVASRQTDPATGEQSVSTQPDQPWLVWSQAFDGADRVKADWTPAGAGFTASGTTGTVDPGTAPAAVGYARGYSYDKAARLLKVDDRTSYDSSSTGVEMDEEGASGSSVCQTRSYTFDANGNRTAATRTPSAANGSCQDPGGVGATSRSWSYDDADRPTGGYVYDPLGRQTTIPGRHTPAAQAGGTNAPEPIGLGYYDTDSARTIAQGDATTSFTLDAVGRRRSITTTRQAPSSVQPTTTTQHYSSESDNPAWSVTSAGTDTTRRRYLTTLAGGLGLVTSTTSGSTSARSAAIQVADPHGDLVAEIPLTNEAAAAGVGSWHDTDEYGNDITSSAANRSGENAYTWHGTKQRAIDPSGLVLMGARLYNPVAGAFTSPDPVYGGNSTSCGYPEDPVNSSDLSGLNYADSGSGRNPRCKRPGREVRDFLYRKAPGPWRRVSTDNWMWRAAEAAEIFVTATVLGRIFKIGAKVVAAVGFSVTNVRFQKRGVYGSYRACEHEAGDPRGVFRWSRYDYKEGINWRFRFQVAVFFSIVRSTYVTTPWLGPYSSHF